MKEIIIKIIANIYLVLRFFVPRIKYIFNKATKFTGIRPHPCFERNYGCSLPSTHEFLSEVVQQDTLGLFSSDQGDFVVVHGNKDGLLYQYGRHWTISEFFTNCVPFAGEYQLVACYNAAREDFESSQFKVIRCKGTFESFGITHMECFCEKDGSETAYVYCSRLMDKLDDWMVKLRS